MQEGTPQPKQTVTKEEAIKRIRAEIQQLTMAHGAGGEQIARMNQILANLEGGSDYSVENAISDLEQLAILNNRNEFQPPVENPIDTKNRIH